LKTILPDIEKLTGATLKRILADAGYRGHNAPQAHKLHVFTTGQKRRMTPAIKRQMKRRAAVEPVIGHLKNGHRMNRNYLTHTQGDVINPILAATGYNFRLILKWIRKLLFKIWLTLMFRLFNQSAKLGWITLDYLMTDKDNIVSSSRDVATNDDGSFKVVFGPKNAAVWPPIMPRFMKMAELSTSYHVTILCG